MASYKVWYIKKIKAKDIREAVKKEQRTKAQFHSIEEEESGGQLESCIGFEVWDNDEEEHNS